MDTAHVGIGSVRYLCRFGRYRIKPTTDANLGKGFGMSTSADGVNWKPVVDVALPLGCRTPLGFVQDEDGQGGTLFFTRRFPDCGRQVTPLTGCSGSYCVSPAQCANVYAARFVVNWTSDEDNNILV